MAIVMAREGDASDSESAGLSALYRLMTWMSPAYPIGAFSYSSGIEQAVETGDVRNAETLQDWIAAFTGIGGGFCDAALFAHCFRGAMRGDDDAMRQAAEFAAAVAPSRERFIETTAQGEAFLAMTRAAWPCALLERMPALWKGPVALPIAAALACAGHGVPFVPSVHAYLHVLAMNLVSAGLRLIPLGQRDGLRILAALEPAIAAAAQHALAAPLDWIGTATFRSDIASMAHETQYTRLFRS